MNRFMEWVKSHKPHTAGILVALIAVIALAVTGASGAFDRKAAGSKPSGTNVTVEAPSKTDKMPVAINITADDKVTDASTPIIVHIESTDKRDKPIDFYHAVDSGAKTATVELPPGNYKITITGVINSDGSVAKPVAANKEIAVSINPTDKSADAGSKATVNVKLDKTIPADEVTAGDVKNIADVTKAAVEKGDESLKGDAGKAILSTVEANTKANKNLSDEVKNTVEESTSSAVEATESKPAGQIPTAPAPASNPESKQTAKTGHYETRTRTVTVPRQVTEQVLVKDAWTEQVFSHYIYHFEYDGFETTDKSIRNQHGKQLTLQGVATNYTDIPQYKTIDHPAEYSTVTKTVYDEKTETYQVWVED